MKSFIVLLCVVSLTYCKTLGHPGGQRESNHKEFDDDFDFSNGKICINMWDEGCANQQINGAGSDDYYLNGGGGFNPGKRCVSMWDDGCANQQINGAGTDDYYINGDRFNPGKRSLYEILMKLHKLRPNKPNF